MIKFLPPSLLYLIASLALLIPIATTPTTKEYAEKIKLAQESSALVASANSSRSLPCFGIRTEPCTKKKACYGFFGAGLMAAVITGIVYWTQAVSSQCLGDSNDSLASDCWKVRVELCGPCLAYAESDWQPSFDTPTTAHDLVQSVQNSLNPICKDFAQICIQTKGPQKLTADSPRGTSCGSYTDFNTFLTEMNQTANACMDHQSKNLASSKNKVKSERFSRLKRIAQSKHRAKDEHHELS